MTGDEKAVFVYQMTGAERFDLMKAAIDNAKTPAEAKRIESLAKIAQSWYKEQDDFENAANAAKAYLLARRKTTELALPFAPSWGGDRGANQYQTWQVEGDDNMADQATDALPFGFTTSQWTLRMKELSIPQDKLDKYFDECVEKHIEPTTYGLIRHATSFGEPEMPNYHAKVDAVHPEIRKAVRDAGGYVWVDTFRAGFGAPDAFVLTRSKHWVALEIKTPGEYLTGLEQKLFDKVGFGAPLYKVESVEETFTILKFYDGKEP